MSNVSLRDVVKTYGRTEAVKGVSFDIDDGELLVILGPSGCGKTSTLRMIAGLESITAGELRFDGQVVNAVAPARRNVAMAFENYGLYEHWSIFDNIAYPLRLRGADERVVRTKVREVAENFRIEGSLKIRPSDLSGGVRQRIGLARALVRDPSVFLLDEPMSHVDADLRNDLRAEIKRIHLQVDSTMIIVTHDQLDALTLGDRILVMNEGRIEQLDTPSAVYDTPATSFVAGFIGEPPMNMIPGSANHGVSGDVTLGIRPHLVRLGRPGGDGDRRPDDLVLNGRVYMVEALGDRTLVTVDVSDARVKVDLPGQITMAVDETVTLLIDPTDVQVFDSGSGHRLTDVRAAGSR